MAHLTDKGEVCHCGFGKCQPQVDGWHLGAAHIEEISMMPRDHGDGRPFIYNEDTNTVTIGPEGGSHWDLIVHRPDLDNLPMGRQHTDIVEWFVPPIQGTEEAEEALGGKSQQQKDWDFTEPMATEPDPEERHHEVQIGNDEPGVPTIGQ